MPKSDIHILALVKGAERYIFLYDDAGRERLSAELGAFASRTDLSFTWYDAAVLNQKIRETAKHQQTIVRTRGGIDDACRGK